MIRHRHLYYQLSVALLAQFATFSSIGVLTIKTLDGQEQVAVEDAEKDILTAFLGSVDHPQESAPGQQAESMEVFLTLLRESEEAIQSVDRYTATLEKQVRVDGELQDLEEIDVKVRHKPYSVYMQWKADGQEVLYVDGEHENHVLARAKTGLAALKGVWKLKPDCKKAMEGNRYPITEIGVEKLTHRVREFFSKENQNKVFTCTHEMQDLDDHATIVVQMTFPSHKESKYSTCKYLFDAKSKLLYGAELCEWDYKGDPAGIAEKYIYHNFNCNDCPHDTEFDSENPEYSLAMDKK